MEEKKVTVSPCTGMSPYGLIARVACSDTVNENEDVISICITATSAESGGYTNLINKYPIIAVNGCENACVGKILAQKGAKTSKELNIMKLLSEKGLEPSDVSRLSEGDEKCVEAVKKKIKELLEDDE